MQSHCNAIRSRNICYGTGMEKKTFAESCTGFIDTKDNYDRQITNPRCVPCRVLRRKLQIAQCGPKNKKQRKSNTLAQKRSDKLRQKYKRLQKKVTRI